MTTIVTHGFNVSDGGRGSVGKMLSHLPGDPLLFSYGFAGPFSLPCKNKRALKLLLKLVKPGDDLIAHSNGALLAWAVAWRIPLRSVVVINPALRRDARWPPGLPVLCVHNSNDWICKYLARWWSRLYQPDGIQRQGWGSAGYYGFTRNQPHVENWDTWENYWIKPIKESTHSGLFRDENVKYWTGLIGNWQKKIWES